MTLYELFGATFTAPRPDDTARFDALVSAGMAEIAMQGKIAGYRITPVGYREANRRWGHKQQPERA